MNALKSRLRSVFRRRLSTANMIRYRVEWPRLREAIQQVEKVRSYFPTRDTTDLMKRAWKLPGRGVFLPVASVDAETRRTPEERRACDPFGILMLYRKTA